MLDKNGIELRTGLIVKVEGGYFKADNGCYRIGGVSMQKLVARLLEEGFEVSESVEYTKDSRPTKIKETKYVKDGICVIVARFGVNRRKLHVYINWEKEFKGAGKCLDWDTTPEKAIETLWGCEHANKSN
jgi:hypothetical protein